MREISRTPLLLAMLCLAFDELLVFPKRRVDLYKEALDTLLKRWDASRGIIRDENYRFLSPIRKEQLLMYIAAENFEKSIYLFRQDTLENQVTKYMKQLPENEIKDSYIDGLAIIKTMESQHGLLSERAYQIYSFSHLSFQEYFTARNIIETAESNSIRKLIRKHLFDDQWHEIILLTASLLNRGDKLIQEVISVTNSLIRKSITCSELFRWIDEKSAFSTKHYSKTRALFLLLIIARSLIHLSNKSRNLQLEFIKNKMLIEELQLLKSNLVKTWHLCREVYLQIASISALKDVKEHQALRVLDILVASMTDQSSAKLDFDTNSSTAAEILKFAEFLDVKFSPDDLERLQQLSNEQTEIISKYAQATELLLECLDLVVIENRSQIIDELFLLT